MKSVWYCFLVVITGLFLTGCEAHHESIVITGRLTGHSDCKSSLKFSETSLTPDSLTCVEYAFDTETEKLTLKHINAGFNCCPEQLYAEAELKGDTILVTESEKSALCDCNCLYDLDLELSGVGLNTYIIRFIEPYASDMDQLIFEIDLNASLTDSFCVTRKHYPWGLESVNR